MVFKGRAEGFTSKELTTYLIDLSVARETVETEVFERVVVFKLYNTDLSGTGIHVEQV